MSTKLGCIELTVILHMIEILLHLLIFNASFLFSIFGAVYLFWGSQATKKLLVLITVLLWVMSKTPLLALLQLEVESRKRNKNKCMHF